MVNVYLCFTLDIVHTGYLKVLDKASQLGSVIIGILSDKPLIGHRSLPIVKYERRKRIALGLKGVDRVLEQDECSYVPNILKHKGNAPELCFQERKEILESIKYIDKVIPSPWKLDLDFFKNSGADVLIHGDENKNDIPEKYLKIFKRTKGISSSIIRQRVMKSILQKNNYRNKKS